MEQRATSYHSQGLVRALTVLNALGDSPEPQTLARLSGDLDVPKSTLVRLLAILEEFDYVFREGEPPTFALGPAVFDLSEKYRQQTDLAAIASPYLHRLAEDTGLTANIGVLQGRSVLHLCVEEPNRPLRFRSASGSLDHAYCTGIGKMLLSGLDRIRLAEHLPDEPYTAYTPHTLTTFEALGDELAKIRTRGCSIDDQERDLGVACIAIRLPVHGVNAALSVAGPAAELDPERRDDLRNRLQSSADEMAADPRFVSSLKISTPAIFREELDR